MRFSDRHVGMGRALLDLYQRRYWWASMGNGYFHISALSLFHARLHPLDESLIAKKGPYFQVLPRGGHLDAFAHESAIVQPVGLLNDFGEYVQKSVTINIIFKDVLAPVTARGDVV